MNEPLRDRSKARLRIEATRERLGAHVREAAAHAAPARLLSAGVEAVKAGAGAQVERVSAMAANPAERPPLLTAIGALLSMLLGVWTRRRDRLPRHARTRYAHSSPTATAVRSGSPWLGLILAVATAYLRRPARPAR